MHKNTVESIIDENRKLEGEHSALKRALDNSQKLVEGLEKEKIRLEFELSKIAGNNINKY
jgi:predicted  nucleic acid-binding Zn-ribbon protein